MNEIEQQIARFVELRGLQTTKMMASSVGVSERTVRRHLDGMIKRGDIKVVAIPNPVLCNIRAWSKIGIKVDPSYLNRVARTLVEHPSVYFVAYTLGRFDIIIAVHFDTTDKLAYFVNTELARVKGILNSETWILASPRKYYGFFWPSPVVTTSGSERDIYGQPVTNTANYQIDDVDRDIIAILREDGLARPETIKSKLSLRQNTIRRRIKHMIENNVYTRQVVLSPHMLEHEVWATIGITTNGRDVHEVLDATLKYTSVYLACVSLGRFNAMIAARFRNMDLLNHFVTTVLTAVDGVSSTETFVHNRPLKYHNIPIFTDSDEFREALSVS